ncbi:sugar ABC transporter permease [Luteipulveratus sp. YIM 133132]|uniref:multiple monosaccharide ABC transporter permease n=1 Tax=Luteipulveratus flavus TaxID=3031728 RepID=UPI0023AFB24D|nr:multiple monosaccharide ABC transporter permease [Luteipulveratus sp. YIM 133132]MDE9364972.1 sugar ABC transporter permease [Luteipulveratus sp. YIM 133132]
MATTVDTAPAPTDPLPEPETRGGSLFHQLFGDNVRQFGMLGALVVIVLFFQWWTGGTMLTSDNMMNLLNGNSYILVLAIGMVMVIIAGHIDLSVGSVAAFVGIVVAKSITNGGIPWWAGILLGLAVGLLVGMWQGFWVAYVGIPAFIVTLAGMLIFRGANQFVGNSNSIPVPEELQTIGGGYLPEVGPDTGYNNLTVLLGLLACAAVVLGLWRSRRTAVRMESEVDPLWVTVVKMVALCAVILYITYMFATGREGTSFPIPGLILVVLVLVYGFITSRTVLGRHVYAVGGNRQAAELSGVKSRKINFLVIMNMSLLAAVAAIMFIGRSTASGPFDGTNWELDAIAAVFIGGAAVSGGVGTVAGSMVGGLVMAVLNSGLQLKGIGADATYMTKGLVLLAAVALDVWNKKQGRFSIIGALMNRGSSREPSTATSNG